VIKILIVALNTSYVIIVANDKEFWMKKKVDQIHLHPLFGHIRIVTCD
jgi:hypothetical protein